MYNVETLLTIYLVYLVFLLIFEVVVWGKLISKAGKPWWYVLIPFYGVYIQCKMVFGIGWLFLIFLIPYVNFIFLLVFHFCSGNAFGKSTGFKVGLLLLPIVFLPIMAFDSSEYQGEEV